MQMESLYNWLTANGYSIGYCGPYDDFSYWAIFKNGQIVGKPFRWYDNTSYFEVISPVLLGFAGPLSAAWSIGGQLASGITGDARVGALVKVAKFASGEIGAPVESQDIVSTSGVDMFDDDTFGSFDFSDGESYTAFSDAENVDYGFDTGSDNFDWDQSQVDWNYGDAEYDFGSTAETAVSDYGTIFDGGGFTAGDFEKYVKGLQVAQQVQKAVSPVDNRTTNVGGGTKYAQTSASVAGAIAKATSKSQGSSPSILDQIGGVMRQIETALPKNYQGQLGTVKTGVNVQKNNTMLYLGAAAIGIALYLHMKG